MDIGLSASSTRHKFFFNETILTTEQQRLLNSVSGTAIEQWTADVWPGEVTILICLAIGLAHSRH